MDKPAKVKAAVDAIDAILKDGAIEMLLTPEEFIHVWLAKRALTELKKR